MAYDEALAERMRQAFAGRGVDVVEKKMFGGLSFMVAGNMCCGVIKDEMMVRVGQSRHDDAIAQPHARIMAFTGRPMDGWVMVGREGFAADADLEGWIQRGLDNVATLPPK